MNPYSVILAENNLSVDSQGDLGALYAAVKLLEGSYASGYTHTGGGGSQYRYLLANFPAGEFKKYAERLFAPKVVLA